MTDSSTVEEQTVDPAASENSDVNTADSSGADADVETSMLDTVNAALAASEESSPSGEQDPDALKGGDETEDEPDGESEDDVSTDEDPEFSDNANKRIRQINAQKKELLTENDALKSENGDLKEKAQRFDAITSFMETASLEPTDVDNGFEIMALLKQGDFVKAHERLAPIMDYVSQAIGVQLPRDLHEQVQLGYMTQENAQALARNRHLAEFNGAQAQRAREQQQQQAQENQRQQLSNEVSAEIGNWYQQQKAKDPDWNLKENRVVELVELHCRRKGPPDSPVKAREIVEEALKTVEADIGKYRPKAKELKTTTGGTSNPGARPEPESMLDVVNMHSG